MKSRILKSMVAVLLSLSVVMSFAACGGKEGGDSANAKKHGADSGSVQDSEADNSDAEDIKFDSNIKVGDYIAFGKYEQDNDTSNGKEDIEWLVLDVQDGKALVISKYGLDAKPYNTDLADVTWETCTLRSWLNNDFINAAFSSAEKSKIPTVTVSADSNSENSTNPGNATQDKVFLLSINEANEYFSSDSARECKATDYAGANGAWISDYSGYEGNCLWRLRSPCDIQYFAAYVRNDGYVDEHGYSVDSGDYAVRPAMWINL